MIGDNPSVDVKGAQQVGLFGTSFKPNLYAESA